MIRALIVFRSDVSELVSFHLLLRNRTVAEFLLERPLLQVDCEAPFVKPRSPDPADKERCKSTISGINNIWNISGINI
jgi:hypothetical protein